MSRTSSSMDSRIVHTGSGIRDSGVIIDVKNLVVHYATEEGVVEAVNNVSLKLCRGETLGLIGETGAGKTTIALSIMGLLPVPPGRIVQGEIMMGEEDLLQKSGGEMRKIRGNKISMIFQDPMTALSPVHTVGEQISEVVSLHSRLSKAESKLEAVKMLETVGISAQRYNDYPHQLSGGQKQRVVIAIALACSPEVLIADEPTTALDVTIQAQILELMRELRKKYNTSMLMITHDFGVVAEICEKCAVIYAGEIVECGTVEHIFNNAMHPYTKGLFGSVPGLDSEIERLTPIPGLMPNPMNLPPYCSFSDRCPVVCDKCREANPKLIEKEPGHFVKCLRLS